jgi:protein-disulfide isomerase
MATLKVPVTSNDHIRGNKNASITLLEYGDFQCPYCGMAYFVLEQVQKHFGQSLRFVFRHFPLTQVHPYAQVAAETAEFASDYKRFWEMYDLIYENQPNLSDDFLIEAAESLGLSLEELLKALNNGTYTPIVKEQFLGGVRSGVNGTPTLFINGQRYNGPVEFQDLVPAIVEISESLDVHK